MIYERENYLDFPSLQFLILVKIIITIARYGKRYRA